MRLPWIAFISLSAALSAGCGEDGGQSADPGGGAAAKKEDVRQRPPSKRAEYLDEDGNLRESDQVIAGLTLPKGLEPHRREEGRYVFYTKAPLEAVQRYFGPRLTTGEVEQIGDGVVYRRAVPREARGAVVKMDVFILPVVKGVRVEVREIRPAPQNPPPREEVLRKMAEDFKYLD